MRITESEFIKIHKRELVDPHYILRCNEADKIHLHSAPTRKLIERLLEKTYPGEPAAIREYKIGTWKSITKTYFSKICKTLAKIRKADDFFIYYPNNFFRDFLEKNYPNGGNFWDWAFTAGLQAQLQEPNGCALIRPAEGGAVAEVYAASQVLFKTSDFYIINVKNNEYLYVDNELIYSIIVKPAHIKSGAESYMLDITAVAEFSFETPPCVDIGGDIADVREPEIFESVIAGVCPFWEQALLDFSELTCGIKQHVFPDKWRYISGACKNCNGTGKVTLQTLRGKVTDTCKVCGGSGDPPTGMFAEILLHAPTGIEEKPPIPPLGYVKKDFEPIEFLRVNYKEMLYEGLRAINLDFLAETPLNQSGRAKELDRQEIQAFLHNFANQFLNGFVKKTLYFLARYQFLDAEPIILHRDVLPAIIVPTHFDFITSDRADIVKRARELQLAPGVVAEIEKRYIQKEFENFTYEKTFLLLCNTLDPLRGYSVDEKIDLYNVGAISELDFIASSYIQQIIQEALETTYGYSFANWKYLEQKDYISKKAEEILNKFSGKDNSNSYANFETTGEEEDT